MRHRIAFVLPTFTTKAVGGYKIIKGYATRLSAMGFDCHIIYVHNVVPSEQGKICSSNFMAYCQNYLRYLHHKRTTTTAYTEHYYYNYAKITKHHFVAIFATLVFTAFAVKALPKHCGEKFYLFKALKTGSPMTI